MTWKQLQRAPHLQGAAGTRIVTKNTRLLLTDILEIKCLSLFVKDH